MANQERLQVLEMVASGTITTEQADMLLDALGEEPAPRPTVSVSQRASSREDRAHQNPPGLSLEELMEAKIHGVNADFILQMREIGFADFSLGKLAEARNHGVDVRFVHEMRAAGFSDLTLDELIEARIHGVDPTYVREMQDQGFTDLSLDQLVDMRNHGLDATYVRRMREATVPADGGEA